MWIMRQIAQGLGTGSDVVAVLAKRFKASEGLISRLRFLPRPRLSLTRLTSRHRIRKVEISKLHLDTSPHGWAEMPQASGCIALGESAAGLPVFVQHISMKRFIVWVPCSYSGIAAKMPHEREHCCRCCESAARSHAGRRKGRARCCRAAGAAHKFWP